MGAGVGGANIEPNCVYDRACLYVCIDIITTPTQLVTVPMSPEGSSTEGAYSLLTRKRASKRYCTQNSLDVFVEYDSYNTPQSLVPVEEYR